MERKNIIGFMILFIILVSGIIATYTIVLDKKYDYDQTGDKRKQSVQNETITYIDSIKISGDNTNGMFDINTVVKRAYEWKYIFAQDTFDAPASISVNKLVQYAFCHLYYENLTDMPPSTKTKYENTTADKINDILLKHLDLKDINITSSDLYNQSTGTFEMWLNNYSTQVYANAENKKIDDNTYEISVTYFSDNFKNIQKGKAKITLKNVNYNFIISKLQ